ncbi:MAG: protein kinase [Acidobacteria bacterium]|nr:protein kinase [Acidobacteriota bacterium]
MTLPLEDLLEGKYEILDKIAEGGIGSIYKVRHQLLDEIRVIKVLRAQVADREDLKQRLMLEAKTAIKLKHPNIARLHDLAVAEDGTAYIVMEYIDGISLDKMLAATGAPSIDLSLEIARQALKALSYLHERGFIHRDISPDNLMLARDFEKRVQLKLIDLGIAKDLAVTSGATAAGTFLGKVKYCAPELFKDAAGAARLDRRSDNYSLGVTLYELVTGEYPYRGETFEELAASHLFHPPREFDETDKEGLVPEALRQAILTALEKDPDKRPADAEAFGALLEAFEIDEHKLAAEFERTVEETRRFLDKSARYRVAGSTQDHLNEQFGVERTSAVKEGSTGEESDVAPPASAADPGGETRLPEEHLSAAFAPASATRPFPWKKAAAALLVAVPLAALGTWFAMRRPVPEPVVNEASRTPTSIITAERFDPTATDDVIDAPPLPTELLGEDGAAAAPAQEPLATTPETTAPAKTTPMVDTPPAAKPEPPPLEPPSDAEVELLKAGPGVVAPQLLDVLEPAYPKPDKKAVVIVISAFVSQTGKVLTATVRSRPSFKRRRYREAAVATVKRAAFKAATKNGVPGRMWIDVEVRFLP